MAMDLPYGMGRPECRINPGKLKGAPQWYPEGFSPHPNNLGPMPRPFDGLPSLSPQSFLVEEVFSENDQTKTEPWVPPVDPDAGDPTGYVLLGEPVRWQDEDPDWSQEERERVRAMILPFLETALRIAEAYLLRQHAEAEEQEPLEVWEIGVSLDSGQQEDASRFNWKINIAVNNAGVCPSHFLTFRDAELIDATAAD